MSTLITLILFFGFYAFPAYSEPMSEHVPAEFIGVWGDEEMCLAYHRNDFYYEFGKDEKITLKQGSNTDWECELSNLKVNIELNEASGYCGQSELRININKEDRKWVMKLGDSYLTKCSMSDMILGIGKDPKDIDGDFGFARHAGFTVGYGTAAATHCKLDVHQTIAQHTLVLGAEAAERYALGARIIPPEAWAQKLIMDRTDKGIQAFYIDKNVIHDICQWIPDAYGKEGWAIQGLLKN